MSVFYDSCDCKMYFVCFRPKSPCTSPRDTTSPDTVRKGILKNSSSPPQAQPVMPPALSPSLPSEDAQQEQKQQEEEQEEEEKEEQKEEEKEEQEEEEDITEPVVQQNEEEQTSPDVDAELEEIQQSGLQELTLDPAAAGIVSPEDNTGPTEEKQQTQDQEEVSEPSNFDEEEDIPALETVDAAIDEEEEEK